MIENLNLKLEGKTPVTRKELFELVSSWGRKDSFFTFDDIVVTQCKKSYSYPLDNLDVSQIINLSEVFKESLYDGDLSKWNVSSCRDMDRMFAWSNFKNDSLKDWDVSNVKNMNRMFSYSKFNNDSISNWNVYNVENMEFMFYRSRFNSKILNWDISKCLNMESMFESSLFNGDISSWNFNKDISCFDFALKNNNFQNKYNNGNDIPSHTPFFLDWFEENRKKMRELNQGTKDEVLDFFSFDLNKEIEKT